MTRFHFERPDGLQSNAQNILVHLNEIIPPQGIGNGGITPLVGDPIKVSLPAIGDIDYTNYKFYQVNKGEISGEQTDFIWEISDTLGPGVFQEASGLDIRPFTGTGRNLSDPTVATSRDSFDPQFIAGSGFVNIFQLSPDRLHLFGWEMDTDLIHEWILTAPGVLPADGTPSDFTFDVSIYETNGRDMTFVDNGNKFMITGVSEDKVHLFSLPTKNSLSTTPIKIDELDLAVLGKTGTAGGVDFSPDGTKFILLGTTEDTIWQWLRLSPFTLPGNSVNPNKEFTFSPVIESLGNCRFSPDGDSIYVPSRDTPDRISKYSTDGNFLIPLGMPEIPTQTSQDLSITVDPDLRGLSLLENESEIFISGRSNNTVHKLFIPGVPLEYEVTAMNVSTGAFTIKVKVPTLKDFDFIQIIFGNAAALDESTALGAGNVLSTHVTPLLTKDEDNILIDDQENRIVA